MQVFGHAISLVVFSGLPAVRPEASDIVAVTSLPRLQPRWGQNDSCGLPPSSPNGLGLLQIQKTARQLETCGFIGRPTCSEPSLQNCEAPSKLNSRQCPTECGYLVADKYFPCTATCVARDKCSSGGPQATLDDPSTKTCKHGTIAGCRRYAQEGNSTNPSKCATCVDMFQLTEDGSCEFAMYGYRTFFRVLIIVVAIVVVIVLPIILYRMCLPKGNDEILRMGWDHRTRCYASKGGYVDPSRRWKPYPLSTNLHETQVAGPGLCIYYNNLVFVGFVALVCAIFTTALRLQAMPAWVMELTDGLCTLRSRAAMDQAAVDMADYHTFLAVGFGALWLFVFVMSVWHAGRQHTAFRELDRRTSSMSDFALIATGLPSDAVEEEIYSYFNLLHPGGLVGVSVAYDYEAQKAAIQELLDHHLHQVDLVWWSGHSAAVRAAESADPTEKEKAVMLLKSLRGSGTAFAVFKSEDDKVQAEKVFKARRPLFRRTFAIEIAEVFGEPSSYFWEHFNKSYRAKFGNMLREVLIIVTECAGLALVIYLPAAYYILLRVQATGDESGGLVDSLLGLLIAIVNGILFVLVDIGSRRIGFHWKGEVDVCNFIGCVIIVMFNTFFNMGISVFAAVQARGAHWEAQSGSEAAVNDVLWRLLLADKVWNMLFPGVLLVPFLLYPVYKHAMSLKALLSYWVSLPFYPIFTKRDLRSNPNVTLREAETGLEPEPMQIEFDYANNICVTCSGFILLFFESAHMCKVCLALVVWALWTYGAQRICHLRLDKLVEYHRPVLHDAVSYVWGFSISLIAGASAYWASKAGYTGEGIAFTVFCTALAIYWLVLSFVLHATKAHSDKGTSDYKTTKKRLRYDYFNTNPVHVLKTRYLHEGHPLVYFQRGKEYLQTKGHKRGSLDDSSSSGESMLHSVQGSINSLKSEAWNAYEQAERRNRECFRC